MKKKDGGKMKQGIVASYDVLKAGIHGIDDITVLAISYRDSGQLLPGGSVGFLTQEEMEEAIKVVAEKLGWELPSLNMRNIFKDVSSGIGWSFHQNDRSTEITLSPGKKLQVYRREINCTGDYLAV